jgi:hypothetical protein
MANAEYYRKYRAKRKLEREAALQTAAQMPVAASNVKAPASGIGRKPRNHQASVEQSQASKPEIIDPKAAIGAANGQLIGEQVGASCGELIGGVGHGVGEPKTPKAITRTREAPTGRKVFVARKPLCPPASRDQYEKVLSMMLAGYSLWESLQSAGCTRQSIEEASYKLDDWHRWSEVQTSNKAAVSARIAGEAVAAGMAQDRVTTTTDGEKETRKVERSIDVAALRLAGEHIAPEIHGKLASKTQVGVQVNIGLNELIAEYDKANPEDRPTGDNQPFHTTTSSGGAPK